MEKLVKTGKQIQERIEAKNNLLSEPQNLGLVESEDGKSISYCYKTPQGHLIRMVFTSPKREKYAALSERLWSKIIVQDYSLLDDGRIALPPNIYWEVYKKILFGREVLKGTGYKMWVDEEPYCFVDTSYYFAKGTKALERVQCTTGVYSISYKDTLLYIGSATDVETRWEQHDNNFRTGAGHNSMYRDYGMFADDLVYRVLETAVSLQKDIKIPIVNTWVLELVERVYIKDLQPKYNIEGLTQDFSFKARPRDLPIKPY